MRIYVSKYVGHGIRVGASQQVGGQRRSGRGSAVRPVSSALPPVVRPLLIGAAVTGGIGVVFPPMFIATLVLFVALMVVVTRQAWREQPIRGDRRPRPGTPERSAYEARAARIAELDRERAVTQAAYERAAACTAERFGR